MQNFRRILVVRTDRIGDVILTLPMLQVLRRNFPHAHVAMLVRQYTRELVEKNPSIDEVIVYDDGTAPIPFFLMVSLLRKGDFDVVFITYPRFRLACLVRSAGIPLRIGTGYRWYSFLFNKRVYVHRKYAERHEAEYNIDLLKAVGCEIPSIPAPKLDVDLAAMERVRRQVMAMGLSPEKPIVILHPGSGGSAREWKAENFGALGSKLLQMPEVQVVVTGGKGEEDVVRSVAALAGNAPFLVNRLSLGEYAALARMAALLVANSTGPLHIAAAVGTHVIGLFPQVTAMSQTRWGPYTDRKRTFVPSGRPIDCEACLGNSGECECMNSIQVEEVFEAARQYLLSEQLSLTR